MRLQDTSFAGLVLFGIRCDGVHAVRVAFLFVVVRHGCFEDAARAAAEFSSHAASGDAFAAVACDVLPCRATGAR